MKSAEITEQGQHTLSEIFSQPQCWRACLAQLAASVELRAATQVARPGAEWIFVGCGTSYYLAQAAASLSTITQSQIAATVAALLNQDYAHDVPAAAKPLPALR